MTYKLSAVLLMVLFLGGVRLIQTTLLLSHHRKRQ